MYNNIDDLINLKDLFITSNFIDKEIYIANKPEDINEEMPKYLIDEEKDKIIIIISNNSPLILNINYFNWKYKHDIISYYYSEKYKIKLYYFYINNFNPIDHCNKLVHDIYHDHHNKDYYNNIYEKLKIFINNSVNNNCSIKLFNCDFQNYDDFINLDIDKIYLE